MTLLQHHLLALALTAFSCIALGIFVLINNPKRWLNRLFALHSFALAGWSATEPWSILLVSSKATGMFWLRLEHIPVFLLPPLIFHLVAVLLELRTTRYFIRLGYCLSALFICGIPFPLLLARQVPKYYVPLWLVPGPLYILFVIFFWAYIGVSLWYLWRGYHAASGIRRLQIKYFFVASLLGYLGGSTDFLLVYNIYIPWLSPYALYAVPIYKLITAYAILQHHFLDIRIVVRKSLIYSTLVTLLTAGYFGLVYGVERIFQTTLGYHSPWITLAAFALMALLFQPLKMGIQRLVDWLIFRVPQQELVRRMEKLEGEARQTEKLKAVATLAAGLCHELRNPLQTIQTHAEFLPEHYDDPAFREKCTEVMRTEIVRINEFLKQLMEFAKPKAPAFHLVEPHKIFNSTLDLLSNEFVKRRVQLDKQYQAGGTRLHGDPDQLRQVILNLILNALEAIGQEGKILVKTSQENGWFTLEVADTGPGIDPKILPKIFEPFTTTKPEGNGLGLSIVHSIVREHRGTISAQNHLCQGTTFIVRIPVSS